ncbi:MAG: hypothetical protein HYV41_05410 [Candidatus Magasanikbacteria bacterium]|nr:hypothetical protein [Candidatus Magasanikbacteria bacterium]
MDTNKLELLKTEQVVSIRDIQKNPSKMLRGITRVMRGSTTHGFFFSTDELEELLEDIEMARSNKIHKRAQVLEQGLKKNNLSTYTIDQAMKMYES